MTVIVEITFMATELKPWSAAEGRLRQEGQVEKLAYFPKRLSASQRMNYFRYGTLQLSTVEFPMYLSFVKYSSVDTFFSQDKYEKFKSQKETFQGEGERLFGFHDNICFKQILDFKLWLIYLETFCLSWSVDIIRLELLKILKDHTTLGTRDSMELSVQCSFCGK